MYGFEKVLQQAVLNNRRVIVPDLGAFINNSSEKTIVFSSLLKTNDGFLEKELRNYGIDNASELLQNFVRNVLSAMENRRRFDISGLGYFFRDNNNIQFVSEIDPEKLIEVIAPPSFDHMQRRRRNRLGSIAAAAVITFVVLGTFTYYIFGISDAPMPLAPLISRVETPEKQFTIADKAPEIRTTEVRELKVRSAPAEYTGNTLNYHVVVGCFEDRMNAERFVVHCKREGYVNAVILSKLGNLHPVSIGRFSSREEANSLKREYNDRFMENAWVYSAKKR